MASHLDPKVPIYIDLSQADNETTIEKYLISHWNEFFNLRFIGRQIKTKTGILDILAHHIPSQSNVVIEIKKDRADSRTLGQLLGYLAEYQGIGIIICRTPKKSLISTIETHKLSNILILKWQPGITISLPEKIPLLEYKNVTKPASLVYSNSRDFLQSKDILNDLRQDDKHLLEDLRSFLVLSPFFYRYFSVKSFRYDIYCLLLRSTWMIDRVRGMVRTADYLSMQQASKKREKQRQAYIKYYMRHYSWKKVRL